MSIALTTEISKLIFDQKVDGFPGMKTNRIETHFDLSKSRTIALSGLIKHEQIEGSEGSLSDAATDSWTPLCQQKFFKEQN